jgi:hypothetical protein
MSGRAIRWDELKFGVEIEFIGGSPEKLELLPGWVMSLDERQVDETGAESGSELKPPPLLWKDRGQIRVMLERLLDQGASANWSCGLHVHVGLESWGEPIVVALIDAALSCQHAVRELFQTAEHRLIYCPPVNAEMRERYMVEPCEDALRYRGRPQSHRCGINTAAWFDFGTVEIRYANGSLNYAGVVNTVEFCLRFVAAVGAGRKLPDEAASLVEALGAPAAGYPPPISPPQWYKERMWLGEALIPVLAARVDELIANGEIHHIVPEQEGIMVYAEHPGGELTRLVCRFSHTGGVVLEA